MIGQTISHYRITAKLGAGGMGVVYRAKDLTLKRDVALKFLPPDLTRDDTARARFIHEAQAAAALDHPNICTVYEIGQSDGHTFIVMPLVEGGSLSEKIAAGQLPLDEALDLVTQAARGLSKAHQSGIIHRDVKPGNILVSDDGVVRIADFGLAKLSGQTRLTRTNTTVGTIAYMSPEQARGEEVDARTDVYSLGAVLYEALTGRPPFEGAHDAAVIYSIMNMDPQPLAVYRPDVPEGLQRVVDHALAKDPQHRYESVEAFIADLQTVRSGGEVVALHVPRHRFRRSWVLAATVITAAFVAGYFIQSRPPDNTATTTGESSDVVAVFPFEYHGGPDHTYLQAGIVDLLADRFDGTAGLTAAAVSDNDDPEIYSDAAVDAGAGIYVTGSIIHTGTSLNVTASLFETGGESPLFQASAEGPDGAITKILDDVAADLLADYMSRPNERTTRVARQTAGSFDSFKWYLAGEHLFRAGRITEAVETFERAVTADTTFALGYYRLAWAAAYSSTEYRKRIDAIERAKQFASSLPERERLLVEGTYNRHGPSPDKQTAERLFGSVVSRYPDDVEASFCLGELLGGGPEVTGRKLEGKALLQKVLTSIPDHFGAITEMIMIAMKEGDEQELVRWTRRRLEVSPHGEYTVYDQVQIVFKEEGALTAELLTSLGSEHDQIVRWCFEDAGTHRRYEDAAAIAQVMTAQSRPAAMQADGYLRLAHLAIAFGRWGDAQEHLAAALPLDSIETIEKSAMLLLTPLMPVSASELERQRDALSALPRMYGRKLPWAELCRVYLTGMISARLADHDVAEQCAATLDTLRLNRTWQEQYSRDLARCVRAEAALVRGDTVAAWQEMARIQAEHYSVPLEGGNILRSRAQLRCMQGVYFRETGRPAEAIEKYENFGWIFPDTPYLPATHLALGRLYEAEGDVESAVSNYEGFVTMWENCDAELEPLVGDARSRLSELRQ